MTRPHNGPWRIFGWPAGIAVATTAGLVAGLIGDGGWDAAAWAGLLVPVAACVPALRWQRARRQSRQRRSVSSNEPTMA